MSTPRIEIDLSTDWEFTRSRQGSRWLDGKSEGGDPVDIPHCWNEQDTFEEGVAYYQGHGSYRKGFPTPAEVGSKDGRLWLLQAGGFYGIGKVRLNGRRVAAVDGQYLGFSLDVTKSLREGRENRLGICLDNRYQANVLPGIRWPDFLLHGGLSARVRLCGVPPLRMAGRRTRIVYRAAAEGPACLAVNCGMVNGTSQVRRASVKWQCRDADGTLAAEGDVRDVELSPGTFGNDINLTLPLGTPRLWSPDSPHLYRLTCRLEEDGELRDELSWRVGCRTAEFRPDAGFFLNGERLELRGCNRHESMPGFGSALPPELQRADAGHIKDLGLNFVRLSHYPQSPDFLDACDEKGLLVYAEIASWKSVRTGRWLAAACRQLQGMIERDRHRPSVILWGLGNESRSRPAYVMLRDAARALDATRPVIYAENHLYRARRKQTVGIPDVWGLNYEMTAIEEGCRASRLRSVVVSECSNYPHAERGRAEEEEKQVAMIESDLAALEAYPCVAGFALWSFSDYATLRKKRYRRYCGIVDAWRMPKMSAALLKARYLNMPFVKGFVDWSEGGAAERTVRVFTNCPEVEIRVNGKRVLTCAGQTSFSETVVFEPGELRLVGRGGKQHAEDLIFSHSVAQRIELRAERVARRAVDRPTVGVDLVVTDAQGHRVLSWYGNACLEASGPGRLRLHRPDGRVPIAAGVGRTFVTGLGTAACINVSASCEGLAPGRCEVRFA